MKEKLIIIGVGIVLLVLLGVGIYYFWPRDSKPVNTELLACNQVCTEGKNCQSGFCAEGVCREKNCSQEKDCQCKTKPLVVGDFAENFFDGKIDDFWHWNNAEKSESSYDVDNIKEEMVITAAGDTSQWSASDTAPTMYFLSSDNFELEVEYDFDPRFDFQHAGIGVRDSQSGDWIRVSRSYDTHSLQNEYDQPNSLYLMERKEKTILKYDHVNFYDTKVYLRMKRNMGSISFEYSRDGKKWSNLGKAENANLNDEVEVYLFAYSTNPNPAKVAFKNIVYTIEN
ncbi:MAG: DUF1349 domain-containing protein [Patescibacteria group bacterium]